MGKEDLFCICTARDVNLVVVGSHFDDWLNFLCVIAGHCRVGCMDGERWWAPSGTAWMKGGSEKPNSCILLAQADWALRASLTPEWLVNVILLVGYLGTLLKCVGKEEQFFCNCSAALSCGNIAQTGKVAGLEPLFHGSSLLCCCLIHYSLFISSSVVSFVFILVVWG